MIVATFTDVELKKEHNWSVLSIDTSQTKTQRFILDNPNIDTNTIRVKVYP